MTDNRTIRLSDAIEAIRAGQKSGGHLTSSAVSADKLIEALSALPAVEGWLDIESAKKQEYVLARVSHDAAHYGGRWFVVRYIGEGDWSLHPGYGVGDDYFSAFMPLPAPPIE